MAGRAILRAQDMREHGIAGTTIQRALEDGDLLRISRGLYLDPDAELDSDLALAEVAKRIPKGVIAMVSALAWHGLINQMPRKTWVAIGASDWSPAPGSPPVRIVRFADKYLSPDPGSRKRLGGRRSVRHRKPPSNPETPFNRS